MVNSIGRINIKQTNVLFVNPGLVIGSMAMELGCTFDGRELDAGLPNLDNIGPNAVRLKDSPFPSNHVEKEELEKDQEKQEA